MMLEGLVAWVLNNYLGKYVENLNTDQLSVALLSGKVELENLPLKKDALRHLGLPVEVKAGFIGKVQLQVPVRQIRSAPWLIAIEKLYLVAAPVNLDEWDIEVEAHIAHERKVALLDALEAQWRAEHEANDAGYYATSYSSWLNYGTGLLANIVENLQLKLKDVHIRYEDVVTCAPGAFAFGLIVESLAAESCDSEWKSGFTLIADPNGCSYKLMELHNLAIYWDNMQAPGGMYAHCNITELTERMSETWKSSHRYIVSPASASARVRRERTEQPLRSRTRPRLNAHLTLDTVLLNLTSRQYSEAVGCALGLERIGRLREFRALRPAVPVRGHARLWWIYALSCHTPYHHWTESMPTWESCVESARRLRQYVEICLVMLSNPAATLPPDKKAAKDDYEWRMPLHVLKPLREIAMRKVPKSTPASTPEKPSSSGRSMLVHWFPQWWGWYGAVPPEAPLDRPPEPDPPPAPPDLEEEILDVIADSIDNNTLLKRDTVFAKFEFILNKGSLNLCMDNGDTDRVGGGESDASRCGAALELQFGAVRVGVESRPRAASHALHLSLGTLCLRERITPDTLFPVLCAPQGVIREGLSAMSATASAMSWCRAHAHAPPQPYLSQEPLFQLSYEKKPFGLNCDYKLWVKSAALEMVYCADVARWVRQFLVAPWEARAAGRAPLSTRHVRTTTAATLITHWEHIVHAHPGDRRSWQVELDISAPQIFFVEQLSSRDAAVLVVDFGRLRLANAREVREEQAPGTPNDDDEMFMTPCSTPPGSLLSPASPPHPTPKQAQPTLDAANLHNKLYERYKIQLSDLQILVGRVRDNWKYAHTKSTSSLHLLDRFSISLQAERRVVHTSDPQYPNAALCGSLPALVAHLSEHKLNALTAVVTNSPLFNHLSKETPNPEQSSDVEEEESESSETERSEQSSHHNSTLFMLQFAIEQLSLEVQSLGRSIAEVQVCGVRAALGVRPRDTSLSLSVHSLLLVDALQTYGPDFELLVASHKHVGMDTASGSILGSEPTSPTSPTSPTWPSSPDTRAAPHPHALHQALYSLHNLGNTTKGIPEPERDRISPAPGWPQAPWNGFNFGNGGQWGHAPWGAAGLVDSEALIAVELCLVKGEGDSEDLRIANILFNNLDIIANQETIVELIGFTQRVMGGSSGKKATPTPEVPVTPATVAHAACSFNEEDDVKKDVRTEITFDFHRLGVLLLRAAIHDGNVVARKIATATISEAKIQATLDGSRIEVGGSLGGVQVVSLCEGGGIHSRVVHAGRAASMNAPLHALPADEDKALLFTIHRKVGTSEDGETPVVEARVCVQVASVWYTHSGPLLRELRSCLSEFKRYLADLARSIRAAAHDMAIGLVHPRSESLYSNPKLCTSSEGVSPRRRTTSLGNSLDDPTDLSSDNVLLSVSIELESPVVVVPRHAQSTQVFVAHLGRMSLANKPGPPQHTLYNIRVRDISLATLDVGEKLKLHPLSAENMCEIYDVADGRPVLHNTALQLAINYCDGEAEGDVNYQCEVSGKIVGGLHVTAHREQYEQLLDTLNWISTSSSAPPAGQDVTDSATSQTQVESSGVPVEVAVPTLRLDPAVRAAVLAVKPPAPEPARQHPTPPPTPPLLVNFELPMFSVELRADLGDGERSLVELAFREFTVNYKRTHEYETSLQVSLHSITMEDLTKERDSKHRLLMVSHTPQVPPKAVFVSKSCPDFVTEYPFDDISSVGSIHHMKGCSPSLPSQLNVIAKQNKERRSKRDSKCGVTPPCSPECGIPVDSTNQEESLSGDDNLVWLSVHTRDPRHPHFEDKFNKVSKLTKVEFNSLNLVVSIDSWVAVLDFFGVAGDDLPEEQKPEQQQEAVDSPTQESGITQTEMSIRSLSVVVVAGRGESCRALVSRVLLVARADAHAHTRHVQGRLGALLLTDLTPHSPLWRDRFRTHGDQALTFEYRRLSSNEALSAGHESSLSIEMGPVSYVHTKRFVLELQAFATEFSLLRRVIMQARLKVSVGVGGDGAGSRGSRTRVRVSCASPVIVVPVSGRARAALAAHLDSLSLDNCFKTAGESGTVSTLTDPEAGVRETLDVRSVRLEGLALWMARGGEGLRVRRQGPPLLHAPAHLTLQIEHNMSSTHNVPDMTIQGTLTTLQCALDPAQYRLVRGVLAHNLAEPVDDLMPPVPPTHVPTTEQVWTTTSLKFDLHDVSVRLEPEHGVSSLACINFIKSRLLVETYSDLSQDIDLVSQEILVSDTRYSSEPANRRGNVFTNIVQPMREHRHSVQAEVHARKRRDSSAYTILVNNMRLMAVLDWWEAANQFIMQPPPSPADSDQQHLEEILISTRTAASAHTHSGINTNSAPDEEPSMELKLNITDSQLVLVEDPSVWDTNAVILRSTTVITYRCADAQKPVSCELNELEVFSCVLGLEEETALSIVDPAALHVSIDAQRVLHVAMGTLNLRLSYHDMRMFASMLQSLPVQARAALSGKSLVSGAVEDAPANRVYMRSHTSPIAVISNPQPSTSAGVVGHPGGWMYPPKWMKSQSRVEPVPPPAQTTSIWPLKAVQVSAECITLCVIDDCLDSDVPLLEVSLADLQLEQDLRKIEEGLEDPVLVCTPAGGAPSSVGSCSKKTGAGGGRLAAMLTVDYYNRILSGWEPIVEPWRFESGWEYSLTSELSLGRVQVEVASAEVLNSNVTSTLIELCQLVKANWAADYYAPQQPVGAAEQSPKGSPAGHRRRSPFVPYALRNHTGHKLWFTALLTTADVLREQTSWSSPDDSWMVVRAGETEPFSFGGRRGRSRGQSGGGVRGAGQHPARLHQLALRMEGWAPPDPVCVDRVGVFFRQLTHAKTGEEARLVFEVSLEGSARKLVTVRSALQVLNKLPHAVEVRVDQAPTTVNFAVASLACAGRARRCALTRALACAQVRLSGLSVPVAIDCEPPVHFLHPLHPLFVNCVQWSGGAVRSAVVDAGECWSAPVSGHASAVRVRPLMRASQLPAPQHTPALVDWRTAPAPCALQHYECRAPPEHVYRFWCVIVRERFPPDRGAVIAGHTLTLMPALRVENLLPLELHFRASPTDGAVCASGTIPPGETWPLHEVNVEEGVEVSVKLEGFAWSTALSVGGGAGAGSAASFSARLKLRDSSTRRLYLNARVTFKKTDGVKVSISAAYWLVNRTGLPLVFRAEGAATDAAGQFDEHEVARMVAPLLFSFAEADGGPTISARVGHGLPGHPEWCSPFGLGVGVAVKKLQVRGGGDVGDAGGERVYAVGVRVRTGRGRYRHTNIVTFTPRYQLHNNTSHHLQFAQKCTATTLNDPGAIATHVSAVSGCYLPWHWARWEREHLLCVRLLAPQKTAGRSTALTAWSGGFRVDTARTLHVACREAAGSYRLVRVEVVCQGATMFVVLTDGESAPPPLRIDNYSPVSIMFHQVGCSEECAVGAHGRAVWALPEPEQQPALALRAPGGPRTTIALDQLPAAHHLLYQNFIYVAFTHTQTRDINITNAGKQESPSNHDNVLVLEVPLGSTRVMLGRKRYGDRSQLWRRGPNDQLIHEGSSPPQPTDILLPDDAPLSPHCLVLDIEDPAPRPGRASALVLRRADGRRASTQAWRLVGGRMCCAHANLCVQPQGMSLMALTPGTRVVLGLPAPGRTGRCLDGAVPGEQAVSWHTLRPGSGRLQVTLNADGPTRLIRIHDVKSPESGWIEGGDEEEESPSAEKRCSREWGLRVGLAGLSVSLVARDPPAELVHALFSEVQLELAVAAPPRGTALAFALAVQHMQWDNQLLGTPSPVLLYCLPGRGGSINAGQPLPALHAAVELQLSPTKRYNAYLFKHLVVALRPLAIRLEERLILKVWAWAWTDDEEGAREQADEADYETRRMLDELTALHATRYYFALIKIIPSQIRLSMCTANKLEASLGVLKRRLGLTMIKFEDAAVELEPFVRAHVFDTASYLARQMLAHFKDELKWQAAKILGSVDFLGNPLGFVADVSEGVTGLLLEGNVGALLQNVTHGLSNSAAKVTASLGDGLERVVGDEAHEETRRRIRSAAPGHHIAAGFRGLGLGILGGMTSLVKHSYEGATQEGLGGFLAGVGKGLVGTVTKPVIGVLDLAAETASALRDTSRRSDKWVPGRTRGPRCCSGPGGLLPRYCAAQAQGAALLYALNSNDYSERFLAYRIIRDTPHDIRALLSDTYLRIFTCKHTTPQVVMETHLSNLISCLVVQSEGAHYVELGVRGGTSEAVRRPRVQCDTEEIASWVSRHAAYARQLYHEHTHTLLPHADL